MNEKQIDVPQNILLQKAAEAQRIAGQAKKHFRMLKADFKLARKAHKQAKKAAKRAGKKAKAFFKMSNRRLTISAKKPQKLSGKHSKRLSGAPAVMRTVLPSVLSSHQTGTSAA
jgi:hypothetical protein